MNRQSTDFILSVIFTFISSYMLNAQVMIPGLEHPYGIAHTPDAVYVSNIGTDFNPLSKDGDGFISKLSPDGEILELNAFPDIRLNAPKGLGIYSQLLYVADIDEIVVIDLQKKQLQAAISVRSVSQDLRDLSVFFSSSIGVVAADSRLLLEVSPFKGTFAKVGTTLPVPGLQSLYFDSLTKTAFVSGFDEKQLDGEIGKIDLLTGKYAKITDYTLPNCGLFLRGNELHFASWQNADKRPFLQKVNVQYKTIKKVDFSDFGIPFDLLLDPTRKKIWFVCTMDNRLEVHDWKNP